MKVALNNRWTGKLIFEAEIDARFETESASVQMGAAIKLAVEKRIDLRRADLRDAYLRGADLRGADLRRADFSGADLRDADFSGADLRDADFSGADLRRADFSGVPKIDKIHQTVFAAASQKDALDMSADWHTCETTHCRAGWVVHLAGEGGKALEWAIGTPAAAAIIYIASDPSLEKIPNFYATNEDALADMKALAEAEAARAA